MIGHFELGSVYESLMTDTMWQCSETNYCFSHISRRAHLDSIPKDSFLKAELGLARPLS